MSQPPVASAQLWIVSRCMRTISISLLSALCCFSIQANLPYPLACGNNISEISGAKQQLQIDRKLHPGDLVEPNMLTQYFSAGRLPTCPAGGTYVIGPIGREPVCSIAAYSQSAIQEFIAREPRPSIPWLAFTERFALFGVPLFAVYYVIRRLTRPLQRTPR